MNPTTQERDLKIFIFSKSLTGKPDDKFVGVNAACLITAFGADVVQKEFGIDVQQIEDVATAARTTRLVELDHEIEEATELVRAGFGDAQKRLKSATAERDAIRQGRLLPKPLVNVEVGKLRRLVMAAREAKLQAKQAEQAPKVKAVKVTTGE